jgi:VWFA-related protein
MQNGSFKPWRFDRWIFCGVALFSLVTFSSPPLQAQKPKPPVTARATQSSGPEFKVRSQSNAVVVHVVVRDSKGRAVSGLQKQDFKLFDNKEPQTISGFSVETPGAAALPSEATGTGTATGTSQPAASSYVAPSDYLAFYFDDLYSAMGSIVRAREAAEKFLAGLSPSVEVAVFTSSGAQTLDFSNDRHKINEVLKKIHPSLFLNPMLDCPRINDYLASQIVNQDDPGAFSILADEAVNVCHWSPRMSNPMMAAMDKRAIKEQIRAQAEQAYSMYRTRSLAVLTNLEGIIHRMAVLPGERQVMVVSDGFISLGRDNGVESLVDRALRARVTISALEGEGLAVNMVETDVRRSYMPSPSLSVQVESYNSSREVDATGTLAEIANGTGGQFFYNQNDLLGGMRKILMPPAVSYVLTFSPSDLKPNGSFHTLKVTLATKSHGLTVLARKGYFAPKGQENPEELAKNEISEAIFSPYSIQGLPLTVQAEAFKTGAEGERIDVEAQLGIRNLPFEKKGDRNVDNVVFAVGLFDHDGKYVTGRQFTYALELKDAMRAEMEKRGLSLKTNVSAKVGAYNLRVVVRDSQGGQMAALSRAVEVPSQTAAPVAKQVAPSEQTVASNTQGEKTAASSKVAAVPSQAASPAAKQVTPSEQGAANNPQGEKTAASTQAAAASAEAYPPMATLDIAPGQGVESGTQGGETMASNKALAVPSRISPPAAQQVAHGDKPYFQAYRRAAPITQWPLKKVRHQIPELKGIEPATDQSQLPEILSRVSANLQKFVMNFVDTSALETVDETETYGTRAGWLLTAKTLTQKFRYLILAQREGGAFNLVEYRTGLRGREEHPQIQTMGFIKTTGFAAMPLFFGPLQQPWSRFRYLGR